MLRKRNHKAGFTLIEMLVAFTVLGLAAGAVMHVLGSSPSKISRAENERRAVLVARSLLDLVGNEQPLKIGEQEGHWDNGVHWKLAVEPYALTSAEKNIDSAGQLTFPYLVTVRTAAGSTWNLAEAKITTIRLGNGVP